MRSRRAMTWLLALALLAGLPVASVAPAQGATKYRITTKHFNVKTKYGDIYAEVARPTDPNDPKRVVKGPAILTYTPYSALDGGDRTSDASSWVPRGYVRVVADVVGTGNSGGCWDYGG